MEAFDSAAVAASAVCWKQYVDDQLGDEFVCTDCEKFTENGIPKEKE